MILAIESSCDESALAIFDPNQGMVNEWIHSQLKLHSEYGGVVPDLATREHLQKFPDLLREFAFLRQKTNIQISKIAVTRGPGLAGCLAMGIALAKALALAWNVPLYGINHLRAHAYSPFIELHAKDPSNFLKNISEYLPHIGFIISGGNTLLFSLERDLSLRILAQTVDDAAGEAFDKGAKLLGLPYPGGALIEKAATYGNAFKYNLPKSFPNPKDKKFSFSGLKTSLRYLLEKMPSEAIEVNFNDLCASYQEAIIEQLVRKLGQVLSEDKRYRSIGLSGGVMNNQYLCKAVNELANSVKTPLFRALPKHSGDNAGMIAFAAYMDPLAIINMNSSLALSFNPSLELAE